MNALKYMEGNQRLEIYATLEPRDPEEKTEIRLTQNRVKQPVRAKQYT